MSPRRKKSQAADEGTKAKASPKLYTLAVYLVGGPADPEFPGQVISRTIQIRGNQTLETLHNSIFKAFNRFDMHMYDFSFAAGPDDKIATYSLLIYETTPGFGDEEMAGDVRTTTIDSLGLEVDETFTYRFDFGDNWMHIIRVDAIEDSPGKGRYPKVVERKGKSPPQYPDEEDD